MLPKEAPNYGEWSDFTGVLTFEERSLWANVTEFFIYIDRPEVGTNITIDDFKIELIPENSVPDPTDVCSELVMNGDAEINGANRYPFKSDLPSNRKSKVRIYSLNPKKSRLS